MPRVKRNRRRHFNSKVRRGQVRQIHHRNSEIGEFVSAFRALQRAERKAKADAWRAARVEAAEASRLAKELAHGRDLLATVTLLLAGYHRTRPHSWRPWKNGRAVLGRTCRFDSSG
jgi:hypothetical protein